MSGKQARRIRREIKAIFPEGRTVKNAFRQLYQKAKRDYTRRGWKV